MIDLDIIGPIFNTPVVEGGEPLKLPGWHVNTTPSGLAARADLEPFVVSPEPSQLRRVWAGDDPLNPVLTVPLRFASETEARAVLDLSAQA